MAWFREDDDYNYACRITFDMSGPRRQAKPAGVGPLDRRLGASVRIR